MLTTVIWLCAFTPAQAVERSQTLMAELRQEASDARIDPYFDLDAFTSRIMQPRLKRYTPAQRQAFKSKFGSLLRGIARSNLGRFSDTAKIRFGTAKTVAQGVDVPFSADLPEEDLKAQIILHWRDRGDQLRIVDISFDDDSLVADYQNQFSRIVDQEGVAAVLSKLDARLLARNKGRAP